MVARLYAGFGLCWILELDFDADGCFKRLLAGELRVVWVM